MTQPDHLSRTRRRRTPPRRRCQRRRDRGDSRADRLGRMGAGNAAAARGRPREAARPVAQLAPGGGSRALARPRPRGQAGRRHVRLEPRAERAARADALRHPPLPRAHGARAVRGAPDARARGCGDGGAAGRRGRSSSRCAASSTGCIAAGDRPDELVEADAAFHDVIGRAPGTPSCGPCCRASRHAPCACGSGTA